MRKHLPSFVLSGGVLCVFLSGAGAQSTPQTSGWPRVQALAPNTSINVKSRGHKLTCKVQQVTPDSIICTHAADAPQTFQRADILTIRISRRGRSTLAGAGIGAGGGAIIGAAAFHGDGFIGTGGGAVLTAVPGILIGALIGAGTDFTHTTLYKAP